MRLLFACLLLIAISSRAQESDVTAEPKSPQSANASSDVLAKDANPAAEPITPEQDAAIRAFVDAKVLWIDALVEMKSTAIKYSNGEEKTPAAKKHYGEVRDQVRTLMNQVFDRAVELFRLRKGDFESGQMMATMLEYRESNSIYENSYEAATLLLETEVAYPFIYKIAARSAFLDGQYDRVIPLYQSFVDVNGIDKLEDIDKMISNLLELYPPLWQAEQERREQEAAADDLPRVLLETSRGPVLLELFENQAPNTVANFIMLVEDGFYDGSDFYQVIDDFIAMGGDPDGDGTGTSGHFIADEYEKKDARKLFRGSLVMAKMPDPNDKTRQIPNTASSQFAISLMPFFRENDSQTVFGRVIEGMNVVCSFRRVDPSKKKEKQVVLPPDRIVTATVVRKRDHDYEVQYVK